MDHAYEQEKVTLGFNITGHVEATKKITPRWNPNSSEYNCGGTSSPILPIRTTQ